MKFIRGRMTGTVKAAAVLLLLCLSAVIALTACGGEQTSPAVATPAPATPTAAAAAASPAATPSPTPTPTITPTATATPSPPPTPAVNPSVAGYSPLLAEAASNLPAKYDFVRDGLSAEERSILDWADSRLFNNPAFLESEFRPDSWPLGLRNYVEEARFQVLSGPGDPAADHEFRIASVVPTTRERWLRSCFSIRLTFPTHQPVEYRFLRS